MAASPARRIASSVGNLLLIVVSVVLSTAVAELVVRIIDERPILWWPMPEKIGAATVSDAILDRTPRAAGVERAWFLRDPPPLPNRSAASDEDERLFRDLEKSLPADSIYRPSDLFKAWNSVFAGDPCQNRLLRSAPGVLQLYDPPDGAGVPVYRFLPNTTTSSYLVTNQIGWRGKPIPEHRRPRTIRIVFVGSSTTIDFHHFPFSYPEFVGHWLDLWAAARHPDVHFEVLNAARESNVSTDIAAVVHTEVLALRPELVIYHEGGNQFDLESLVEKVPSGSAVRPPLPPRSSTWLQHAARYMALAGRLGAAVGYVASDLDGREWPKPDYRLMWPPGLDEFDPDIDYPNFPANLELGYPGLPVNLNVILHDLDRIRDDLATVGGELGVSTFLWMVKDGLVLNPIRHRYIIELLNVTKYPFRYRDLERLATFQNRVLAAYAKRRGLPLLDMAGDMPFDPDLFTDAVHTNYAGTRMRGWVTLQQLIPVIERHLADGSWPRPAAATPDLPLPTFTPRRVTFSCAKTN